MHFPSRTWTASLLLIAFSCSARAQDRPAPDQKNAAADISVANQSVEIIHRGDAQALLYFSITNNSDRAHLINGVSSPSCENLRLYHPTQANTGMMIDLFDHLTLAPRATLRFPDGAYRLVCISPTGDIRDHQKIEVKFSLLGGDTKTVSFPIMAQ